ncbi:MAG: hypothetical protein M1825_002671 [Sarcosagium campestre]|nr:MAG: hypothetical protein M1825_002671 [Sarcosagium campestre]
MTKLILSTSTGLTFADRRNILNDGPSVLRRRPVEKSNHELTTSLRTHLHDAIDDACHSPISPPNGDCLPLNGITNGNTTSNGNARVFGNGFANGHRDEDVQGHLNGGTGRPLLSSWTSRVGDTLYIPSIDPSSMGLAEETSQYDITVKLFFLPNTARSRRSTQTKEAISLVLQQLKVKSIDLVIVSFPGISFVAEDEDEQNSNGYGCSELGPVKSTVSEAPGDADEPSTILETWHALEELHLQGTIGRLGVSEFGSQRLAQFIKQTHIRPSVDQINLRDCCTVPKPLISLAHREGIELLTHSDCTNILPRGTIRELLGRGERGAGVLISSDSSGEDGLMGDVEPQFVVKYTAVVRDRGVVENKGYFAMADLNE